jgi:hypothetical protein
VGGALLGGVTAAGACGSEDAGRLGGVAPEGAALEKAVTATTTVPCVDPPQVVAPPVDGFTIAEPETPYSSSGGKEPKVVFGTSTLVAGGGGLTTGGTSGGSSGGTAGGEPAAGGGLVTVGGQAGPVGGGPVIVDVPNTCQEHALVRFGPLPAGMPPIDFPHIDGGCDGEECIQVALGWVHAHHAVWRLSQMFEFMADLSEAQRSFVWDRPGETATGDSSNSKSKPSYWFGPYESGRFQRILKAVRKYSKVIRNAKIDVIDLHVQCPTQAETTNPCVSADAFGVTPGATHWTKGYINICANVFFAPESDTEIQNHVNRLMAHEPLHHVFVDGLALSDTKYHGHGLGCGLTPETETMYFNGLDDNANGNDDPVSPKLEHMRSYVNSNGSSCSHRDKLTTTIDSYARFANVLGQLVKNGNVFRWPKWGDPTPQPPTCVGDIGCLCSNTGLFAEPDGDYSISKYCEDTEEEPTVCMKTKFNASSTVGICTNCADKRGPGCSCDDSTQPCDAGFCWGQDTGPGNVTGICYNDPPPYFGCIANCEALFGAGGHCLPAHQDGARCVPYGIEDPQAYACWMDGGFFNENGDCSGIEIDGIAECGPLAIPANRTCQQRGYPDTFVCDAGAFRCVAAP